MKNERLKIAGLTQIEEKAALLPTVAQKEGLSKTKEAEETEDKNSKILNAI